ncbi:hypothetical protein ES705_11651 [subsurface metagenome]
MDKAKDTDAKNEVLFISGQRGSGKSYWTKRYLAKIPRAIIYDALSEYDADKTFYDVEDLVDFLIADRARPSFFSVSLDSIYESDFPVFCRAALACENVHIVIEEIDLFSSPTYTPPELLKLLKYGRHWGIQIIGISRRPAEVSRHFTANANRFVVFYQHEPRDLAYFRSIVGSEADKIQQLTDHQFLDIDFKSKTYETKNPL